MKIDPIFPGLQLRDAILICYGNLEVVMSPHPTTLNKLSQKKWPKTEQNSVNNNLNVVMDKMGNKLFILEIQ